MVGRVTWRGGLIKAAGFRVNIPAPKAKSAGQCKQPEKKLQLLLLLRYSSTPATCVAGARKKATKIKTWVCVEANATATAMSTFFCEAQLHNCYGNSQLTSWGCKLPGARCPLQVACWPGEKPLSADSWEIRTVFVFQITCTCCSSPPQEWLLLLLLPSSNDWRLLQVVSCRCVPELLLLFLLRMLAGGCVRSGLWQTPFEACLINVVIFCWFYTLSRGMRGMDSVTNKYFP